MIYCDIMEGVLIIIEQEFKKTRQLLYTLSLAYDIQSSY